MAFNPAPGTWITGWTEDGTNIAIANLATAFPELTAVEADATTGDIRKVLFAIMQQMYTYWASLPTADRPTKMTIARTSSVNETTDQITRRFTFTFVTESTDMEVVAE